MKNLPITTFLFLLPLLIIVLISCSSNENEPDPEFFQLLRVSSDLGLLSTSQTQEDLTVTPTIKVEFTSAVDTQLAKQHIYLKQKSSETKWNVSIQFLDDYKTIQIKPIDSLLYLNEYEFTIENELKGIDGQAFPGATYTFKTENGTIKLLSATINGKNMKTTSRITEIDYKSITVELEFSEELPSDVASYFILQPTAGLQATLSSDKRKVTVTPVEALDYYTKFSFIISAGLKSTKGYDFSGFSAAFYTGLNPDDKMSRMSDDALLTEIQKQTFRYFWDYAHPVSGLARERYGSGETVTMGGSGFGLMGLLVGIERNFITKTEGISQISKIVNFLKNADRYHGAWPHWLNGSTGKTIAFSTNDNGADLVETAFMAQALIATREYLNTSISEENAIITVINELLDTIEWNWFTRDGQNVLYWHWSPDKGWAMNMTISGYNEALIVYVLAATSKNYSIDKTVYTSGWARNGGIINNKTFYNYTLPLGYDYGGPLFFAHYSFLGLDPRNLSDSYGNYWTQNRMHSLINYEHSVRNPYSKIGYSEDCWGLTASDDHTGYGVHEPTRDNGTISPTAALSSFPYSPDESMKALKHFYYVLGDKLWGDYGFYDAFNPTEGWWAKSYLAIDQGPILVMIENHRTALIWNLFMQAPEVKAGLDKLGFNYTN